VKSPGDHKFSSTYSDFHIKVLPSKVGKKNLTQSGLFGKKVQSTKEMMNLFHLPRLDTAKIPLVKINQRQIIISFALEVRRSLHSTSARLGIFPLQAQK